MLSPLDYIILYSKVHFREKEKSGIKDEEIKLAVKSIEKAYKPNPKFWIEKFAQDANDNDPASSLGGGPGIDVIGIVSALHRRFGYFRCSMKIIELMAGWKDTFDTILSEFQDNYCGLSGNLTPQYFQYSYLVTDLLGKMNSVVNEAIGSAHLITMVKFLSAVTCKDTAQMIRNIFKFMRPGAVVFIIDNASGGYSELVSEIARECCLKPIFSPMQHLQYTNDVFKVENYDSRSCSSTRMTVHLLIKPYPSEAQWNSPVKRMDWPTSITEHFPVSPIYWHQPLQPPPYWHPTRPPFNFT